MMTSSRADYEEVAMNVSDDAIEIANNPNSDSEQGYKPPEDRSVEDGADDEAEKYSFDTDDEETNIQYNSSRFCSKLASDLLFVLGSLLYVVLAFEPIEYYQWSDSLGLPQDVVDEATDDAFWWTWYDENGLIPEDVYYADNATLYAWYEDSFPDEGIVFEVGNTYVTRFMIYYFIAAICFLMVGVLSFWVYRHWFGIVMTLAGAFGVASSMLVVANEWLATVFNSVSVHLFALEAIYLFLCFSRQQRLFDVGAKTISADSMKALFTGDIFFVIGTFTDVFLSYVSLVGTFRLPHAYASIGSAACWLICSIIYLFVTIVERHRSKVFDEQGMAKSAVAGEDTDGSEPESGLAKR